MGKYELRVVDKRQEANDAVSIVLECPEALRPNLQYQPGQFLTLEFAIDGKQVRRAYSLSSCPFEDRNLQVTVKRVDGGLVSNHIHNELRVGDTVTVQAARGRFGVETDPSNYKTYYLFGAGSGITPLFSIVRSVLVREPKSHVFLFFGNRTEYTIIFRRQLSELDQRHGERLQIVHALSRPRRNEWSSLWNWDGVDWSVRKGRIDEEAIRWFFKENPPISQTAEYYVCGPGSMIESVESALRAIGVPDNRIHCERFATNPQMSASAEAGIVKNAKLVAQLNGKTVSESVQDGQTLLRCLLSNDVDTPYSCETGVCGSCKARLKSGTVHVGSIAGLDKSEIDDGYILACQAKPTSKHIEIEF